MLSRPMVFGYHGCDARVARQAVCGEIDLVKSESIYEWLGHGTYFWEDSPDRAMRWAVKKMEAGTHGIKVPSVLGAIIDLGRCLNLIDSESLDLVKQAHSISRLGERGRKNAGSQGKARALDCAVIETLHALRAETGKPPFDTVRSFFMEGRPLYEGAGFRELDHVQICVRTPERIRGYFLPR